MDRRETKENKTPKIQENVNTFIDQEIISSFVDSNIAIGPTGSSKVTLFAARITYLSLTLPRVGTRRNSRHIGIPWKIDWWTLFHLLLPSSFSYVSVIYYIISVFNWLIS